MDETWKTRDGRDIDVSDMEASHVLNTLRMLERNGRLRTKTSIPDDETGQRVMLRSWCRRVRKAQEALAVPEMSYWDYEDMRNGEAYRDLANPNCYFPLLGVHGSPELQARHGRGVFDSD